METILAERIVSLVWRLKRAQRMQDEVIDVKIRLEINGSQPQLSESLITGKAVSAEAGSQNPERCYDDLALGSISKLDFAEERVLERLSLYERRFEASLFKTKAEFEKLREARKAKEAGQIDNAGIENVPDTNVRDTFSGRRVRFYPGTSYVFILVRALCQGASGGMSDWLRRSSKNGVCPVSTHLQA